MNTDPELRKELLERINTRRASINAFIHDLEPRGVRQTNTSIICSALAAVLTAGPAFGGTSLSAGLQRALALPNDAIVWRFLCLAATIASLVAAISTNLYKSNDVAGRLSKAEAANAGLEGVETLLEFGQVPIDQAVKLYQQYVTEIPFIPEPL
jgi:hypothetical protein